MSETRTGQAHTRGPGPSSARTPDPLDVNRIQDPLGTDPLTSRQPLQLRKLSDSLVTEDVQRGITRTGKAKPNRKVLELNILEMLAGDFEVALEKGDTSSSKKMVDKLKGASAIDDEDVKAFGQEMDTALKRGEIDALPPEKRPSPPYDDDLTRMASFKFDTPATWELNAVAYLNGTDDSLGGASDASKILAKLKKADLEGNTRGRSGMCIADKLMHSHLQHGSWGVAFMYKKESDGKITPYVIDVAYGRGGQNGNEYKWETGGTAHEPQNATLPA